jgi:hypothetical protein
MYHVLTINRYWEDLNSEEKAKNLKDRLKKYTQKVV